MDRPRDYRKSKKGTLFLSAKRKRNHNLKNYNRCKALNLPYVSKCKVKKEQFKRDNVLPMNDTDIADVKLPSFNFVTVDDKIIDLLPLDNVTKSKDICTVSNAKLNGRRIVQIDHFFDSLKGVSNHIGQHGCTFNNIEIIKEMKQGLNSIILLECNTCKESFHISTNNTSSGLEMVNINLAAVEGIMGTGSGFTNLQEFLSALNIPCMNEKTYAECHKTVFDAWETAAYNKMLESGKQEAEYAITNGNVDANGTPCITVVADDGCWSKHSFGTNDSLSGTVAIIGHQFGKVLHIGIKNKYCSICIHAKQNNIEITQHECSKHFNGVYSASLETNIILEGFKHSISIHGIKYTKVLADSTTYNNILNSKPYNDTTVEKIECRNVVLMNFCNKLKSLCSDKRFPLHLRKILYGRIVRLKRTIISAINFRKSSQLSIALKIELLKGDIENSIKHVFGEHSCCDSHYCKRGNIPSINRFIELNNCPEFCNRIIIIIKSVSRYAHSLIYNFDRNIIKQFHSELC